MTQDTMTPEGLKAARKALELTQGALAAAIGMHVVSVAKMESGTLPIEPRTALAVECLLLRSGLATRRPERA